MSKMIGITRIYSHMSQIMGVTRLYCHMLEVTGVTRIYSHMSQMMGKSKARPVKVWTGPEGSRSLRLPHFKTIGT
jgi:hypothetical protein